MILTVITSEGSHEIIFHSIGFLIYGGKKGITQDLTFLVLFSKICIIAVFLYSLLTLKNGQSDTNIQNLFKILYLKICFHICMYRYTYIHIRYYYYTHIYAHILKYIIITTYIIINNNNNTLNMKQSGTHVIQKS